MIKKLFIEHSKNIPSNVKEIFKQDYRSADKLILIIILFQWVIAALISSNYAGYFKLGIFGGGIASGLALVAYFIYRGELIGRCLMATSMVIFLAIFVQQMNGLGEAHFQYFMMVGLLIAYKDKIPLLFHTILTVFHHLSLTYCQANGIELFGEKIIIFSWGNFIPLILHLFVATCSVLVALYIIHISTIQFFEKARAMVVFKSAANGDLDQRVQVEFSQEKAGVELNQFMDVIKNLVLKLESSSSELAHMSEELSASTIQMDKATEEISMQTEDEVQSISETKESTSNMIELSNQTQSRIVNLRNVVEEMNENATVGTSKMEQADESMNKIQTSSRKIDGIVTVITEIANQTNLLSLNAAIEAAKAGEMGKGFAVVADEVRNLAERSNKSVTEIQELIEVSNENVEEGVQIIQTTLEVFKTFITQVKNIMAELGEIGTAFDERIREFTEVSESINGVLESSQNISAATHELSATTKQVSLAANKLKSIADDNQTSLSSFNSNSAESG